MIVRAVKTALISGIAFGALMAPLLILLYGTKTGSICTGAGGGAFGIILSAFVEWQRKKMESPSGNFEGEEILFQGPANHFLNRESRGGFLTLTPTRLAFRSHGMNVQNSNFDVLTSEIEKAWPARSLGIIPNGLRVQKKEGAIEKYVVMANKDWVARIMEIKGEVDGEV